MKSPASPNDDFLPSFSNWRQQTELQVQQRPFVLPNELFFSSFRPVFVAYFLPPVFISDVFRTRQKNQGINEALKHVFVSQLTLWALHSFSLLYRDHCVCHSIVVSKRDKETTFPCFFAKENEKQENIISCPTKEAPNGLHETVSLSCLISCLTTQLLREAPSPAKRREKLLDSRFIINSVTTTLHRYYYYHQRKEERSIWKGKRIDIWGTVRQAEFDRQSSAGTRRHWHEDTVCKLPASGNRCTVTDSHGYQEYSRRNCFFLLLDWQSTGQDWQRHWHWLKWQDIIMGLDLVLLHCLFHSFPSILCPHMVSQSVIDCHSLDFNSCLLLCCANKDPCFRLKLLKRALRFLTLLSTAN